MIKKKTAKRLITVLTTFVMLLTMIPVGVYYTVFAADANCMAVEVQGTKVYFYGAKTLDVSDNSVAYTSNSSDTPMVYIDGVAATDIDDSDIEFGEKTITFSSDWLNAQDKWIAINFDSDISVQTSEPSVTVDTDAPIMTESDITGNPTDWVKDKAELTVSASDGAGTGVVAYSNDNVNWQETGNFEITENGDYTFYAKDAVGNISNGVTVSVTKIDNIAPTIGSVKIDPETWKNKVVKLVVTAEDTGSGLAAEAYKMDDREWQNLNEFEVSDSANHTFTVRDAVGNEQTTTASADKHDVVKPKVLDVDVKLGKITIEKDIYTSPYISYDFYISGYDDKSGVAEYSKDGINWQASNKFTMKGAGTYTFYVKDSAGNISDVFDYSLKDDTVAPTIESITPNTTEPTNKEITIIVAASDNEGGADLHDKAAYAIDSQSKWQKSNSFKINDSDEHTVYVRDNAKPENIASQTFTAENFCDEKPTIEDISLSTTDWTKESVTFSVIAKGTKNNAGKDFPIAGYKMDDGEWQTSKEFVVSDCLEHNFVVKDTAGNESVVTKKAVINYDNNKPVLADGIAVLFSQDNSGVLSTILNKITFGRFFNEKLVISVNAKDIATETSNVSGIEKAIFKFVDEKEDNEYIFSAEEIGNSNEKMITFNVEAEDLPTDFEGNAKVVLTDAAGNENTIDITTGNSNMGEIPEDSKFYFMIENTPPNVDSITTSQTPVDGVYKNDYSVEFKVSDNHTNVKNSGLARIQIKVNGTVVLNEDYQNDSSQKPNNTLTISTKADETKVNNVTVNNWNKGELKYEITVVDNAGNQKTDERTYYFDQTAPKITGFEFSKADKGYYKDEPKFDEIYEAVSIEDYGFYFKNTVSVTISAEDIKNDNEAIATGLKSITVYLKDVDGTVYLVKDNETEIVKSINNDIGEAEAINTQDAVSFVIPKDFKGQIFAFATDNVGNYPANCRFILDNNVNAEGFVHPDGSVVETEEKHADTSAIEFTAVPTAPGTQNNTSNYSYQGEAQKDKTMDFDTSKNVPLYNNDISFDVKVTDTYSGIREVSYTIIEGKDSTTKTVVVDNDGKITDSDEGWIITNTDGNLATEMTNTISVLGNYNDMVLLVELTDRAGNKTYDYYVFGIDKTSPSITVTYNNNHSDKQSGTGDYFKANRTATILVQERNFNTENVEFTLKNAEGEIPEIVDKGIVTKDTDGNGDGNVYK
ncbi:MAG: Ig-like domain repeat protein, partial [Oscillospiraceae bacterium]|nr:Ig-like domain repeat protein [Oscillospiraceae bacterium]